MYIGGIMYKKLILLSALIVLPAAAYSETYWGGELPYVKDTAVEAEVTLDGGIYTYSYSVHSGFGNSGNIWRFRIDIQKPRNTMTLSMDTADEPYSFAELSTVPVKLSGPSNWRSGLDYMSTAGWGGSLLPPGQSLTGLQMTSPGLPGIREFRIQPRLAPAPMESNIAAVVKETKKNASLIAKTIGPTAPPRALSAMFDTIGGYITESLNLGWLTDSALADSLRAKLTAVKQFVDADDGIQAKAALSEFMTLLDNSSASQRTKEGYGLLFYNAKYLKDRLSDIFGFEIILDLEPVKSTMPVGASNTLVAALTGDGEPMQGYQIYLAVISGPNEGLVIPGISGGVYPLDRLISNQSLGGPGPGGGGTDENGLMAFRYYDLMGEGTDKLEARAQIFEGGLHISDSVKMIWEGGPDLVIDFFIPPMIKVKDPLTSVNDALSPLILEAMYASASTTGGGQEITIREQVSNKGNVAAGPSVLRYYLSEDEEIDPMSDTYIGERQLPSLEPGESSGNGGVQYSLPSGLTVGAYYHMGAIVDAENSVIELNETNNGGHGESVLFAMVEPPTNQPPVCDQAFPGIAILWPPNHKTVKTGIVGVTDPDGDEIALQITGITQDEPVNGLGDGDTAPDGFGVGSSKAELRAERSGTGNGRVYAVHFAADDGNGGQCTGSVNVAVPHDKGKESAAIDDGQAYDSTQP